MQVGRSLIDNIYPLYRLTLQFRYHQMITSGSEARQTRLNYVKIRPTKDMIVIYRYSAVKPSSRNIIKSV